MADTMVVMAAEKAAEKEEGKMKLTKLLIFACMFMIMLAGAVCAERYVQYNYFEGRIASNGVATHTTTPVTGADAIGFVCTNNDCSSVSGTLWNGAVQSSGSSSSQVLTYPTTLQNPNGYGIFHYKPGYITWEAQSTWWGTKPGESVSNPAGPYSVYLSKKENCHAPIDTFTIVNDVQPNVPLVIDVEASLDATTYAAIHNAGPLAYIPPALANAYYSVETRITLTITKDNGQVFQEIKVINIPYSGSARVQFTWTPTIAGDYKAVAKTYVSDAKCISSMEQAATSWFTVISEDPKNMCYTLLNDLAISNQFPTAGDTVTITANKISNYADNIYALTPVPTSAELTITRRSDGTVVRTESRAIASNSNAQDVQGFSFDWTIPNTAGWYDIKVHAVASDALCPSSRPNLDEIEVIGVYVDTEPNGAPVLEGIPDVSINENQVPPANWIDLWQYASDDQTSDADLQFTLVSQSNPGLINCRITGDRYINCNTPAFNKYGYSDVTIEVTDGAFWDRDSFRVNVIQTNNYPIISNIPNVRFYVGDSFSLDLDHYTHDPDNTNDELRWSWTGNSKVIVDFNNNTHVVTFSGERRWIGEERITFTVTDPSGLSDSDICIVSIEAPEPENDDIIVARISNTDYILPGDMLYLNVGLESNTYKDLENLKIVAVIPDLGIRMATGFFDLEARGEESQQMLIEIPEWAAPGYYDIRITISNDYLRRVIHRDIKVI